MNLLTELDPVYLDCRAMGHSWYHRDDDSFRIVRGRILSFDRHEECARCGALRRRTIDLGASRVSRRSTKYPPGYRLVNHPRTTRFDALEASYTVQENAR